ncbi:Ankyrin repeat protein [Pyrenophora tritici-repentis]|nr:Ankyrin repeat protein [Pyrenophora tritici-repentis]KAI0609800.1 Ankyrin repeat protein [Pyrenophora tritici-repentis]KAI1557991.1 ankyrin repeat-containing protein [Pyrenophora tritici-repentis]
MVAGPHTSAFRLKHWITAGITDLPESEIDESSLEFRRHLLSVAAWIGDKSLVVKLVEEGCNHNDNPSMFLTPLRAASYRGHIDIVKFLMVDNSGDAPALRDRPLLIMSSAAHHNHTELIEIALDNSWHRGEVELTCIRNAMHSALRVTSDSETFTRLLQDADPPMTQYDKSGLLLNAAAQGKLAIVKHLIEREAYMGSLTRLRKTF